jgi:hypothetical protein
MRKVISLILVMLFPVSFAFAGDVTLEELQKEISDLQGEILKMSRRVDKNEVHRIKDKVDISLELRSKVDSISYKDVRALPQYTNDMLGLWLRGYMTTFDAESPFDTAVDGMGLSDGFNDSYMVTNNATHGAEFANLMMGLNMGTSAAAPEFQQNYAILTGMAPGTSADAQSYLNDVYSANRDFYNAQGGMGAMLAPVFADGADAQTVIANLTGAFQAADPTMTAEMAAMNAQQFFQYAVLRYMFADTTLTDREVAVFKSMFKGVKPRKYEQNNSSMFTNKLRIRLNSRVNDKLSFAGRLTMYKAWSDATEARFMDGTFKSMYMDGNAAAVPTDDKLHVERAYFVYKNNIGDLDYHFSFGRRPSATGPGKENAEYATLGGSPLAHILQWQFDGASLQFNFENLVEWLPGSFIKLCYGKGYESGWGHSNAMAANNGLIATPEVDDVEFLGVIIKFFDNDDYKFWYNYAKGFGITDGFTGTVIMPFSVVGQDYDLDGEYEEFELNPNYTAGTSRMEAMTEIGDMEWHSFLAQGYTFGFNWFASYSMSKSDPKNTSLNPMYQFMDQDEMLGSDDSKTGYSYWFGVSTPELPGGGKIGFEFNKGSKYWVAMTGAEDDVVGSKLAVRGSVYELYYHQPIVGNRLFATIGYQHFDYDYTGSGNYMGTPTKIDDVNGLHAMMPVVDKVDKLYASFTYRY